MNAKHTAGPWYTYQVGDGTRPIRQIGDDYLVASVMPSAYEETAEANARLIASSPDLLEALVELLGCISETRGTDATHAVLTARDAIAKATGEDSP